MRPGWINALSHDGARRLFWPVTAALLAYLCAMQLFAAWRESNIGDEPLEIAAGYSYLKTGDFRMNPEHPPLAKILAALPLLALHPSLPLDSTFWTKGDEAGFGFRFFEQNSRSIDTLVFTARLVPIFLTACLGLAIALWTRSAFGPGAAMLALALYAFDPTVTAHGHYVKNDVPVTLFCFLAAIAWCAFLTQPGLRRLSLAGVALGLAVATKFSALFLLPVLAILYAIRWWQGQKGLSLRHGIGSLLAAVALAAGVVFLIYGILAWSHGVRLGGVDARAYHDLLDRDPTRAMARMVARGIPRFHPFIDGLIVYVDHDTIGHQCYLLGMRGTQGWWYYFPVAFAVKTPAATLALLALAGVLLFGRVWRTRIRSVAFPWFAAAVPAAVFCAFSLRSHLNIGIRHLVPIWPFVFILAAAAVTHMRFRYRPAVIALLVTGLAAESVAICPHYLAFFNFLAGGPANGPAILADSNIDWGQDAKNLAAWLDARHISQVCLDYWGTADIGRLGVHGPSLPATWETARRASLDCVGAISTNILYDPFSDPRQHAWLRALHPVTRIGYSIYIYDLRKERALEDPRRPGGPPHMPE
jgi:4-amino-4-deoxy-L-arabinose transferase-like glycosyltransferase